MPPVSQEFRDAQLLLSRAGFGGLRSEIEALAAMPWADAVESVLDTSTAPDPYESAPDFAAHNGYQGFIRMVWFWLDRARDSRAPIVEKMVLFWHDHFACSLAKVGRVSMYEQNQIFRGHALGNFPTIVREVCFHAAMIEYLDNQDNVVGEPNENLARELMELFTLGVGNYTEEDVRESARAWTGHAITRNVNDVDDFVPQHVFNPDDHDPNPKTFFNRPAQSAQDIIDLIFSQKGDIVARFMAEKLWSFFAHPDPSPAIVTDIAAAFGAAFDIKSALRAIFLHPEFRSEATRQGLIKSPIEWIVSAMRHTGMTAEQTNPQWSLGDMGQQPFWPPDVSGWKQNAYWVSPSAVWAKAGFASGMRWYLNENSTLLTNIHERTPEESVAAALEVFGIYEPAPSTVQALEAFVRSERATSRWAERPGLLMLPLLTPDFQVSA